MAFHRTTPWIGLSLALGLAVASSPATAAAAPSRPAAWPQLSAFIERFASPDGRIIDPAAPARYTTSEGQSYALFFALVADDRALFDKLLVWTRDNLAAGDLGARLPAWQWGQRGDGSWGVVDPNAASDADVWLAYTLIEAGRRWNERRYRILGKVIANRIISEETDTLPGLGLTLLPGPVGFHPAAGAWRLNPSYLPLPLLQALSKADDAHADAWRAIAQSAQAVVLGSAGHGFAPDWIRYETGNGFRVDPETRGIGSYNAIRVYLWASALPKGPERSAQLAALGGIAAHVPPPEQVDTVSGEVRGTGPSGFMAALVPYHLSRGNDEAAANLLKRVEAAGWPVSGYYDSVLTLFGVGLAEGRYCFDGEGHLQLGDPRACAARLH